MGRNGSRRGAKLLVPGNEHDTDLTSQHDNDSAFGDSLASSTTSLRSAITKYQFEHGRRYHAYRAGRKEETRRASLGIMADTDGQITLFRMMRSVRLDTNDKSVTDRCRMNSIEWTWTTTYLVSW